MLRSLLSLIALAALAGTALAADYVDTDNTFRFTMPEGWQTQPAPLPQLKVTVASPRIAETGGNCNVVVALRDELKSVSQTDLDAEGAAIFNDEFWRSILDAAKFKNIKIEKSGVREQNGRKVFYVRETSEGTIAGTTLSVAQWQDAHLVPGALYMVTCTALAESISLEEADFTTVTTSFEPILATPTAAVRAPGLASLTLYERPRFAGVSRVITQDTADLTRFGWSRAVASFSVAGTGAWEICDGANFSGRCRTVSGSNGALPGFAAISARRVTARLNDAPSIAAALTAALTESRTQALALARARR
jgi:hypothetical protein